MSDDTWPDLDTPASLWPSGAEDETPPPRRWVWDAMQPGERAERLTDLARWVQWLTSTFELHNDIPTCWYRHRALVERLTALYTGWARTYIAPSPAATRLNWSGSLNWTRWSRG